jgi:hypothetical protein
VLSAKSLSQVVFLFLFLSLALIYLRYFQRRTLFYPAKEIEFSPKEEGLDFKEIFFNTPDHLKLHSWFIPAKDARYTVLFCHGNAGNISHRLEKIIFFNRLGCNVFIFDYRGYGQSQGEPSENGLYTDAKSAYNYLLSRGIKAEQIIGYGESLGTAAIIDLASKEKMRALIIDSAFSSGKDMARAVYPFLPYWIFSVRLDSVGKIKSINAPKLMIHSVNDEIVPYRLGKKLYEAALPPKEFLEVHGGHNSCFYESEDILKEKIADFLKQISR